MHERWSILRFTYGVRLLVFALQSYDTETISIRLGMLKNNPRKVAFLRLGDISFKL